MPILPALVDALPEALLLGGLSYAFGAVLKLSDLLQEHGYRWFRGSALAMGALGTVLLLVVLGRASDLHRVFWLAVLLHWVLRGRIDGVNHGLVTAASLLALALWDPSLLARRFVPFLFFALPLTALGLLHDLYQYTELPGPAWFKAFLQNQHLYWYLIILCHPMIATFDLPFAVATLAFVKGYGLFYSERACAFLPRFGIRLPA